MPPDDEHGPACEGTASAVTTGSVWVCDIHGQPEIFASLDSWKVDGWPEGWASVCVGDEDGAEHFLIVPWDRILHAADVEAAEATRPQYGRA